MGGFDLGSALGIAAPILGGMMGGSADADAMSGYNALREQLFAQIELILRESGEQQSMRFGEARDILTNRNAAVMGDLASAESNMQTGTTTAKRGVLDREKQQLGQGQASLASRGLGGSTVLDNFQRGVQADTNRSLGGIDQQYGQMMAGLDRDRASVRNSLESDLASLSLKQNAGERSLSNDLVAAMLQFQPTPPNTGAGNAMGGIGGMLGGLDFGSIFGGGGGGSSPGYGGGTYPWGGGGKQSDTDKYLGYATTAASIIAMMG